MNATPPSLLRRGAGTALALAIALTVAGCGSSSSSSGAGHTTHSTPAGASSHATTGSTYTMPLQVPQGTIDPLTTADYNAMFIVGLASAGLVIENPAGQLKPQLASAWTQSADKKQWTVKLRPGETFSDGKPITPADVVWTFDQIIAPKSESPAASSFKGILTSVSAGGKDAVIFHLAKPYADFPYLLTGANTDVYPAHTNLTGWIHHPVGAGQFVLKSYSAGAGVVYTKNPHYWDASAVDLGGVDVKFFTDTQSMMLAFQSGEVDQLTNTPVQQIGSTPHRVDNAGWEKFDGLVFNTTVAPLNNVKVRQAIAWSLNRKSLVSSAYEGEAVPGNDVSAFPDYSPQPQGLSQRTQNLAKVKQLLAGVSTPISFTITTYNTEQNLAQAIQQQLQATGDFKVKLDVLSEGAYYASSANSPWLHAPVTITDWADRLPAQMEALLYAKGAIWNASHYSDPRLDALTDELEKTSGQAGRQKLIDAIAKIEWTDVPVIVPAFVKNIVILSPKVKGTFIDGQNFSGGFDFRGISVTG